MNIFSKKKYNDWKFRKEIYNEWRTTKNKGLYKWELLEQMRTFGALRESLSTVYTVNLCRQELLVQTGAIGANRTLSKFTGSTHTLCTNPPMIFQISTYLHHVES